MRNRRSDWLPPLAIFIALGALAWVSWRNSLRNARDEAAKTSQVIAASTAHQLEEILEDKQRALDPLGTDILDGPIMMESEFHAKAGKIQARYPEILAVLRLDRSGTIVWSWSKDFPGDYVVGKNLAHLGGH